MANILYERVSTAEQSTKRQKIEVENRGIQIDKVFEDHCSGKDTNRPGLKACLEYVREGDTLYIHSFDRLARNTKDLLELTEKLKQKGVVLISLKEGFDTDSAQGKMMMTMLGAIAEFERELIKQRQKEGIALVKGDREKYPGRKPKQIDDKKFEEVWQRYLGTKGMTKKEVCKELGIS